MNNPRKKLRSALGGEEPFNSAFLTPNPATKYSGKISKNTRTCAVPGSEEFMFAELCVKVFYGTGESFNPCKSRSSHTWKQSLAVIITGYPFFSIPLMSGAINKTCGV